MKHFVCCRKSCNLLESVRYSGGQTPHGFFSGKPLQPGKVVCHITASSSLPIMLLDVTPKNWVSGYTEKWFQVFLACFGENHIFNRFEISANDEERVLLQNTWTWYICRSQIRQIKCFSVFKVLCVSAPRVRKREEELGLAPCRGREKSVGGIPGM